MDEFVIWAAIWATDTSKINMKNLKHQINTQSPMLMKKSAIKGFFHTNHVFQLQRIIAAFSLYSPSLIGKEVNLQMLGSLSLFLDGNGGQGREWDG